MDPDPVADPDPQHCLWEALSSKLMDINFGAQVLNMLGKVVTMKPAALQKKRENKNTVALDSEQNAIQVNKTASCCGSGMINFRIRFTKKFVSSF